MSRFLFASTPAPGHLEPVLPIVRALVDAGHEVVLTAAAGPTPHGSRFPGAGTAAGGAAAAASVGVRFVPLPAEALRESPPRRDPPPAGHWLAQAYAGAAAAQATHVLGLHAEQPFDALVTDLAYAGGPLAREAGGPPLAHWGPTVLPYAGAGAPPFGAGLVPRPGPAGTLRDRLLGAALRNLVATPVVAELNRQRAELGLVPTGQRPYDWNPRVALHLQLSPAGFEYPRADLPAAVHFVGTPQPAAPAGWEPPWWADVARADRPVVVLSGPAVLRPALAALADEPVLVLTLGAPDPLSPDAAGSFPPLAPGSFPPQAPGSFAPHAPGSFPPHAPGAVADPLPPNARAAAGPLPPDAPGSFPPHAPGAVADPLPPNARAAAGLPAGPVLRHAAVLVTDGAFGPVQAALSAGTPLVVLGRAGDQPEVAARVGWSGCGVPLRRPTPRLLRAAVRTVLDDPAYARRAAELGRSAPSGTAAARAATLLERLARTGRPVPRPEAAHPTH